MSDGKTVSPFRQGIGWRLLLAIVVFSSCVTLALTAAQLYLDYRTELREIGDRLDDIERSYLASLGASLWSLDTDQIRLQVEGIRHLPDVSFVEVKELGRPHKRQVSVSVGERGSADTVGRDYPINYSGARDGAVPQIIGVLHVRISLAAVYGRLAERAMTILASQGIKTFLVSAFILVIVHRMVTRHLFAIGAALRDYRLGQPAPEVSLDRKGPSRPDELDELTSALNAMSSSLTRSLEEQDRDRRRLRRQEAALERAHRHFTTQETAAKLAHEIKQPLACVSTYVQGLQAQVASGTVERAELADLLHRVNREVQRVRDVIAASQDSGLSATQSFEPMDMSEVVSDVLPLVRQICKDAGVSLDIHVPSPGPRIRGNPVSLQQVIVNLVRNACEAMAPKAFERRLRLAVHDRDGQACLIVQDSGPGFSRGVLRAGHALFSSSKPQGGGGFGLPIAAAIIASHGGRMEIGNDGGSGARVTCWLPKEAEGGDAGRAVQGGGD